MAAIGITKGLHLSGHGYYDDHIKLINALNPTYYMPIHGEFHMLVHNARLAEKECHIPRQRIFVCDAGDIIEIDAERQAKKAGRIQVGGVMYDDSGAIVSEVVLKDRIHMSQEGMFVVVLTVQRGTGRLLTSPDIISRGFIYLRDSEELMSLIRQYLKQKATRSFAGKYDLDVVKKEIRDEVTHILYDQTRRTPIVIPVINEIGGLRPPADKADKTIKSTKARKTTKPAKPAQKTAASTGTSRLAAAKAARAAKAKQSTDSVIPTLPKRRFPARQVPDTEANDTKARERSEAPAY